MLRALIAAALVLLALASTVGAGLELMAGLSNATLTIVRNLTLALIVSEFCGPHAVSILVAAYGLVMYLTEAAASFAARRSTLHEARLSNS